MVMSKNVDLFEDYQYGELEKNMEDFNTCLVWDKVKDLMRKDYNLNIEIRKNDKKLDRLGCRALTVARRLKRDEGTAKEAWHRLQFQQVMQKINDHKITRALELRLQACRGLP